MNSATLLTRPLLFLALCSPAAADVVTIGSDKDNTLYEDTNGDLSNGAGKHFFTGLTGDGDVRRGLISFDIDGPVPAGSTIDSVTLTLRMSRGNDNGTQTVSLHRLLADWGEGASDADGEEGEGAPSASGDATWLHTFYSSSFWATQGGDFAPSASASLSIGNEGFYSWSSTQMRVDVQAWLDDPGMNFGWLLKGAEPGGGSSTAKRFDTRDINDTNRRPELSITFTPPSQTGACCFGDGSCSLLSSGDCTLAGGTYQGDGTSCSPNPCPQPLGACCFDDGSCSEETLADCASLGGTWQGPDTDCTPNPCPQPLGACCFDDGTCAELTANDCASQSGTWQGADTTCLPNLCPVILEPFVDPLPLPAVAVPVTGSPGDVAYYEIAMTEFQQQLHRDLPPTTVWGYGGSFPGPTIEAGRDAPVSVLWINDLRDGNGDLREHHLLPVDTCPHGPDHEGDNPRTVVHLHGGHVEAEYDGYPEDTFLPGQSTLYIYPNNQLPATLWYHDHALGITRLNVQLGLAAFYLLRDDVELKLDLPSGEFEIPLAIQDRSFNSDGSFQYPADWQDHFFGDTILVNGKVWPYLEVKQGKYRFRLLDGSNSRTYTLALSNGATFHQIGTDGGLLPSPVPLTELTITPGERADIVIDFAPYPPGTELFLVNSAPAPYPGTPGEGVVPDVLEFIVQNSPGHTSAIPDPLRAFEPIDESEAIEHRSFELRKTSDPCTGDIWLINGLKWDDITERPLLGTTEVWSFVNRSGGVHPMHMHLVMFQILDRQPFTIVDGEVTPSGPRVPPPANEAGWKDTVQTNPMEITRVIARFEDYTGKFAYHCHILEHEDHEMMRQFEVIERKRRLPPRRPREPEY